ncbi:hypothetical protein SAMN00808754_1646 [Thermanaeromonas toyohensis ToBE]|uniref:Uncharacterized protein n=1 Tax=Thermanaeromonas toyohensis ToBE TaxID=698762 RepID=A0A1W1VTT2_9FIRM|nr:hypothetical protein [Thermanaeromonas toyohensis]SMB96775.1 hypothetical protein SAMN00808754_1646 [Thermanaeromonas toyohensis ToBE]
MSYYLEMRSKYGFSDGELVPAEAEVVRSILVEAINAYLGPDSKVEAYEYDRPGMHNPCLIMYRDKKTGEDVPEPEGVEEFALAFEEDALGACYEVKAFRLPGCEDVIRKFVAAYLTQAGTMKLKESGDVGGTRNFG